MHYYTYLWLRNDGTPYYVGKGKGRRAFVSFEHTVRCPEDSSRIVLRYWDSEAEAFDAERKLISRFGRKDIGTGILRNMTDGGDAPPSWTGKTHKPETIAKMKSHKRPKSQTTRSKISGTLKGRPHPHSLEHLERLRQHMIALNKSRVGTPLSPEHKAKLMPHLKQLSAVNLEKIRARRTGTH